MDDERFAALIAEYEALGAEARDLRGLEESLRGTAEEEASVPERVSSMAEVRRLAENARRNRELVRAEVSRIAHRVTRIGKRRRQLLKDLEAGMPLGLWVGYGGDRDARLVRGEPDSEELELQFALSEAVARSPAGSSLTEIRELEGRIEWYGRRGWLGKALYYLPPLVLWPLTVGSCCGVLFGALGTLGAFMALVLGDPGDFSWGFSAEFAASVVVLATCASARDWWTSKIPEPPPRRNARAGATGEEVRGAENAR